MTAGSDDGDEGEVDPLAGWHRQRVRWMARTGEVDHPHHHMETAEKALAFAEKRLMAGIEDPASLVVALGVLRDLGSTMRVMAEDRDALDHAATDAAVKQSAGGLATGAIAASGTNPGKQASAGLLAKAIRQLLDEGKTHAEVASTLGVSTKTVQRARK